MTQKGFTLIELMITVAIIGILAAVAIPAYQDFTVRARVSEVLAAMSACKLNAVEFYSANGGWARNSDGATIDTLGMCDSDETQHIPQDGVTIAPDGTINASSQNLGGATIGGENITMRPVISPGNEIVGWICGDPGDGTDLASRYRPGSCQG
ncbi:MAG: pilin [Xanthomonadales bacterium]|nr:pilin [Xanthomonadales bacterium]